MSPTFEVIALVLFALVLLTVWWLIKAPIPFLDENENPVVGDDTLPDDVRQQIEAAGGKQIAKAPAFKSPPPLVGEGTLKKNLNDRPTSPRPPPPKGQVAGPKRRRKRKH